VNLASLNLQAKPSTSGQFSANLPANTEVVTGDTPLLNTVDSTYSVKSSFVAYDNIGNAITLDVCMTKTSAAPDEWEVAVFNQADATDGGFPYGSAELVSGLLEFDDLGNMTSSPNIDIPIPNGDTLV